MTHCPVIISVSRDRTHAHINIFQRARDDANPFRIALSAISVDETRRGGGEKKKINAASPNHGRDRERWRRTIFERERLCALVYLINHLRFNYEKRKEWNECARERARVYIYL